jgi:cytoskeletal protein RodZ
MSEIDEIIALGVSHRVAAEVGERLRTARERSNRNLSEIATHIKVREHYLIAIESGSWNILPSGMNGRGFVRIYAKELNVPVPEIETKMASGDSDPTEGKSAVRTLKPGEHTAPPPPIARNVQNPAQKPMMQKTPIFNQRPAATPTATRTTPHITPNTATHDEDDSTAIDASGEMASLLGIDETHFKPRVMPPMHREVTYEGSVPVVNADILAHEMFLNDETPLPIENRAVEQEAPPKQTAIVEQPQSSPSKELQHEHHKHKKSKKGHHGHSDAPSTESTKIHLETRQASETPIPDAMPETAPVSAPQPEPIIPTAQQKEDVSKVVSPAKVLGERAIPVAEENYSNPHDAPTKKSATGFTLWRGLMAGVVALVAATLFVVISNRRDNPSHSQDDQITTASTQTEGAAPAEQISPVPQATAAVETTPAATANAIVAATQTPTPETTEPVKVEPTAQPAVSNNAKLKFTGKVGINIRIDGKQFFSGTKDVGELELSFTKSTEIYTDDASKVVLEYAGWENHGALGWPGRKRRLILNASGYPGTGRGSL